MDKAEYREKLEQITELVNIGDFKNAQTIVDEVEWRRVKSARTLCMVSEIYEKNNRLPDSRRVLEWAYRRTLVKTVAYRLVEVCLALNDVDAAQDYYDDFADLAPMDNSKYVLKYKLLRAKNKPLKEQIEALEIYRDREYTEQWAYELAKLYNENGNAESCIAMCDDLILWFNDGPYVLKALELKMQHSPLSPSQQEKYKIELEEHKKREKEEQEAKAPIFKHPGLVPTEEKEESLEHVESKKEETKTEEVKTKETKTEEADLEKTETEDEEAAEEVDSKTEEVIEKLDVAANTTVQSESGIKLPFGKFSAGNIKSVLEKKKMQNQLADSIRNVFAGIGQKGVKDSEELEETENASESMNEDLSEYEIKDLEPETVPEEKIDTSEMVLEEPKTEETEAEEVVIEEQEQEEEQKTQDEDYAAKIAEFDFEALFAETTNTLAMELATGVFSQETVVNTEEEADRIIAEEIARIANEEAEERKALEEAAKKEAEEAARKEAEEAARKEAEEAARKEAEEAARKEAEEAARKEAEEAARKEAEEAARKEAEEAARKEAEEAAKKEAEEAVKIALAEAEKLAAEEIARMLQADVAELTAEPTTAEIEKECSIQDELKAIFNENTVVSSVDETCEEEDVQDIQEEDIIVEVEPAVPEEIVKKLCYVPVEDRPLTEEEKNIFTYFADIPGLSQQITKTLCDVHNNAGDKTSKSGNFLVIGRQGAGKTRLYESMVLAICKDLDIDAAKNAKILAEEFNKKDPAAVVAKLSGGFLAIEAAGSLSDEAAEKLSQAMEFRTDSLIVVLEDEKEPMYKLLEKHPNLAEKFTSTIKIPVFTNDELVTFARIYALEQGYSIDEMGVLALYTKIGENQKDTEPMTVGSVKKMMDAAMTHANKGHRKLSRRFSKNAVDDENRIILLEKDFE